VNMVESHLLASNIVALEKDVVKSHELTKHRRTNICRLSKRNVDDVGSTPVQPSVLVLLFHVRCRRNTTKDVRDSLAP